MQISVSGKGVDVGEAFQEHVKNRLTDGISKYIDRVNSIDVVVSKESHLFRALINGNTGTSSGMIVKGRGEAPDVYAAFDMAADRIEKQLRRYKRRLTNHHKARHHDLPAVHAMKYVISADAAAKEAPEKEGAPVVVAEKATDIATLTVSEAVMRMDLADLPALMFFNSANGRLNVVYKRADGNISWVDPKPEAAARTAVA